MTVTLLTCPPFNIPLSPQIGDSVKNGILQLAKLLERNYITNTTITNQEKNEILQQQQ